MPEMSGVPIPARLRALDWTGGKFTGMRMIVAGMPCSSRISQKALPCLKSVAPPRERGTTQSPRARACLAGSIREIEKSGSKDLGSR